MEKILKYPRTPHIEGSRLQAGDEDLSQLPFESIAGRPLVVEEKVDGANVGISFTGGELCLQSRGHFLRGGAKERDYELFKLWGAAKREELYSLLGERYVMYGEWLYRKHRVYYNSLPHFFMEFDIFDRKEGVFLDTGSRKAILSGSSVVSAPVLYSGVISRREELLSLLTESRFITGEHIRELVEYARGCGMDENEVLSSTDGSRLAEGLYIKLEGGGRVTDRMKYVRPSYLQTASADRWHAERIIPNKLKDGADIFA